MLGDLQGSAGKWCWLYCERCQHRAPFAVAAAVIRWGRTLQAMSYGSVRVALHAPQGRDDQASKLGRK
jgi:hypothetical protein